MEIPGLETLRHRGGGCVSLDGMLRCARSFLISGAVQETDDGVTCSPSNLARDRPDSCMHTVTSLRTVESSILLHCMLLPIMQDCSLKEGRNFSACASKACMEMNQRNDTFNTVSSCMPAVYIYHLSCCDARVAHKADAVCVTDSKMMEVCARLRPISHLSTR